MMSSQDKMTQYTNLLLINQWFLKWQFLKKEINLANFNTNLLLNKQWFLKWQFLKKEINLANFNTNLLLIKLWYLKWQFLKKEINLVIRKQDPNPCYEQEEMFYVTSLHIHSELPSCSIRGLISLVSCRNKERTHTHFLHISRCLLRFGVYYVPMFCWHILPVI